MGSLQYFISTFTKQGPHIPVILDESSALECIKSFSGLHMISIDEYKGEGIPNIFFYEKQEDKKHMSITDIRNFINEVTVQPYGEKGMYILTGFDTATPDAMNACLKILEEPPEYAIILLIVEQSEKILETIHSRTITLTRQQKRTEIHPEIKEMIQEYFSGNTATLISHLFKSKYSTGESIDILAESIHHADNQFLPIIEGAIGELFHTNENPRNILDRVFLCRK